MFPEVKAEIVSKPAFVVLTFLMEYRQILDWVNKEDWSALLDVGQSQIEKLLSEQKEKNIL